jgi:hypothetical protein
MNVSLDEHWLGGLRWIVLRGPDRAAFRALGEHMRDDMAVLTKNWGLVARLREHVAGPPGRNRLDHVRRASALQHPEAWAELAAFADGSAVPFDDLALMNFRGDLGPVTGGIGCSDLAWRRERSLIGHNEDGAPENVGQCALLTLALDSLPIVTAFWYPGFLPANAFAVTADGLVWSIDHLPVASPGDGAARHFVGRGLQRSARTLDAAVDYLKIHPSAGGFAYTIGDQTGRIVNVEAVAGHHAVVEARPESDPLLWHTNHGRYLPGAEPAPNGTSVARGQTLSALTVPEQDPDPAWFLSVLADAPLPHGVRADPGRGYNATTLCTFIADLTAGQAVIAARDEPPVTIPLPDLAEGNPHRQRQLGSDGGHEVNPGFLPAAAVQAAQEENFLWPRTDVVSRAGQAGRLRVLPGPGPDQPPGFRWAPSHRRSAHRGTSAGPGPDAAAGGPR